MKPPERIQTPRLSLRKPIPADAEAIFRRYAADPVVTRYLSWPTHRSVADTQAFLSWSDEEWRKWPAGPYLVFSRDPVPTLLGSTGLAFKTSAHVVTGFVFAQDAWQRGFATEALAAMVDVAGQVGVKRLEAVCHAGHKASAHVLEKCGFKQEELCREHFTFPNLKPQKKSDVLIYVLNL
ncbi:MAG TPA: GNAT family N-acetyltransferase [Terracidiphilus sp.]|nr:GNAT family N-acetyltransferase [Terracidiphilus sp.]